MLRQEIARARPGFRVSSMRTQEEWIESQTIRERLLAMLARFFAGVALLLAGVGLYGVLDIPSSNGGARSGFVWRWERSQQMWREGLR